MADREPHLKHVYVDGLPEIQQLLLDVYAEVYAEKLDQPFFRVERYAERLALHVSRNNWETVIAYEDDEPVGYAYACALQPGARWWVHQLDPLPEDFTEETGRRTLSLNQIMVRRPWRGMGIAQHIHDELLSGRDEERVTLLVDPRNAGLKRMYESWGYEDIGAQKPFPDSPLFSTMVRSLRTAHTV